VSRELAPPRSKMRRLAAIDRIAHWRLEETAGGTIVDDAGNSNLTSIVGAANIVEGDFYGESANRARLFASGQYATGASTAGQRAAMIAGNWTIEAWVRPTSLAGINAVIAHGSNAAGEAANFLASLRLDGASFGTIWQRTASKTTVQAISATAPVTLNERQHLAVRCRAAGSNRDVTLFRNGVAIEQFVGLLPPTGGASGIWELGALPVSHGSPFDGEVFECRFSSVALSDEAIRDSWARGVRDYDHATLYASGHYEVYGRALIESGASWIDLSNYYGVDWIEGLEWEEAVDDQGASGSLSLRRQVFDLSMVPSRTSSWTNIDASLGEVLRLSARVRLEAAVVPLGTGRDGVTLADWLPVFDGFSVAVDAATDPVKVELFDRATALQDVWVEPNRAFTPPQDREYGTLVGIPVEPELQKIVDDNIPPVVGYRGGTPTIYTPVPSGVNVRTWQTASSKNVLSSLEDVVTQWGFDLRYVWDDVRQEYRLTYAEPPRGATWSAGSPVIGADLLLERARLETRRDDIRNVVEVEYGDEDPDHIGTIKRLTVVVENAASIARYGRRYCRIGLATDSQINDLAGATALAQRVLSDLAWPLADVETALLFRHDISLHDVVRHPADAIHFDAQTDLATVGVRHSLRAGSARTTLTQRGLVSGKRWKWFGVMTMVTGVSSTTPPAAPTGFVSVPLVGGARFSWTLQPYRGSRRYRETELHWSTTNGFTPTGATLRERARGASSLSLGGMTPGVVHYARVGHVDEMGNTSAWSPQVTVTPRQLPAAANVRVRRSANQVLATGGAFQTIAFNIEDVDPLGVHDSGTGTYTARHAGLLDVDARCLYDSNAKPASGGQLAVFVDGVQIEAGAVVLSSGTPDRAQLVLRARVLVAVGSAVTVRVSGAGNAGHFVVVQATNTRCWFIPVSED
jgi:hypothetical protein